MSGKTTLYSCYPLSDYPTNECLDAFHVGNGQIEKLDIDKLISAFQENKKAIAIFHKNNLANNN